MITPGSSAWRLAYWPTCGKASLVTREFGVGRIKLTVAKDVVEAVSALFDVFDHYGYLVRQKDTGAYNCRVITNGSAPSAHASAVAIDVNWLTNPYTKNRLVSDLPTTMTTQCQNIVTTKGVKVWRWGGDWDGRPDTVHSFYDAMHFEIIATPEELRAGIERATLTNVVPASKRPVLSEGSRGPVVVDLQRLLTNMGFAVPTTGTFLHLTDQAVREYQKSRGLGVDGVVGPGTWTALLAKLPPLGKDDIRPGKANPT